MAGQQLSDANHCVIDNFLGDDGLAQVEADVMTAKREGLIVEEGRVGGGRDGKESLAEADFRISENNDEVLKWYSANNL